MARYRSAGWLLLAGFVACRLNFSAGTDSKIVGGVLAPRTPYVVAIQRQSVTICGGTLLTMSNVLTACHCIGKFRKARNSESAETVKPLEASTLRILAGHTDLQTSSDALQIRRAKSLHAHPNCKVVQSIGEWDFAVMVADTPFNRGARVRPIKLYSLDKASFEAQISLVTDQTQCWVMGWGRDNAAGNPPVSRYLRRARMRIVPDEKCRNLLAVKFPVFQTYDFAGKAQICTLGVNGSESDCIGDSGGPFVCGKDIIAIVSYGFECGQSDSPAVYAKLPDFVVWYKEMEVRLLRSSGPAIAIDLLFLGSTLTINFLIS